MGWRVRRSLRLGPGLRVNLGKRGASLSVGGHGLTKNFSSRGVRTTVGLPGAGISYSTSTSTGRRQRRSGAHHGSALGGLIVILGLLWLLSWVTG